MARQLLGFAALVFGILALHRTRAEITDPSIEAHDAEHRLRFDLGIAQGSKTSMHVLPPHTNTTPVTIRLGISPIIVKDLDAKSQTLTMECWLKLNWNDSRLQWDTNNYNGTSVLRVANQLLWQPDIKIYNTAQSSKIDIESMIYAIVYSDGSVVWIPPLTTHTICAVDLKYYPYDEHECFIKLGSWTHDGEKIDVRLYEAGSGSVSLEDMWNEGGEWELVSGTGERNSRKYSCCDTHYPDVTFHFVLRRRSPLYKLTIMCPIIAAMCLALATFWLPPNTYERLTMYCVSLLVLVLTLLHLDKTVPSSGVHSPLIVSFCGYMTVLVAIMTIVSIVFLSILRGQKDRPVPHWIHRVLNSWASRVFCISDTTTFEPFSNSMDRAKLEVDSEDPQQMNIEVKQNHNSYHWFRFFQLVDHITFAIFAFITVIALLVTSI